MRRLGLLVYTSLLFTSTFAWNGHYIMTKAALRSEPTLTQHSVKPESLAAFLSKEQHGIAQILNENEAWAAKTIPDYPLLPNTLRFDKNTHTSLVMRFIHALRINPGMTFPLFLQVSPDQQHEYKTTLPKSKAMLEMLAAAPWIYLDSEPLKLITPAHRLAPIDIIATASDEPDYGMDLDLWEDNHSAQAALYQWGEQPFGNKDVTFATQAPFHMGFFYESKLFYWLAPFFKHSYIEYRAHTYLALSRYAFKTHHDYWGYRFLGWALHYAQDLTQPYHATLAPNYSTASLIWIETLDKLGIKRYKHNATILITNRHYALEDYLYYYVRQLIQQHGSESPVIKAAADISTDANYPAYTDHYLRQVIAKESHTLAKHIDDIVRQEFPERYVDDPNYVFYMTEPNINMLRIMRTHSPHSKDALETVITNIMRACGAHTRHIVKYARSVERNDIE